MPTLSLSELAAEVNKKAGEEVVVLGSRALSVPRLSTGILSYDLALGGGWASNQWNEIVGEWSSGKTSVVYKTIAAAQEADPEFIALWVAAETFVPELAEAIGVDLDRLWVIHDNRMEAILNTVLKAVSNRAVDMVVIDSIPALVTDTETNKNMDEASVATGALILSRFFRKCVTASRRSLTDPTDRPCTLMAINQWRDKIGVMFGDPRTTPGGKAKDYFYFIRIEVRRDEWISEGSKLDTRVGQTIKMRSMKNKTHRSQQVAQVDFYFADTDGFSMGEFDTVKDVVNVALALELFQGRYSFEGERIASKKEELYEVVRNNPELYKRIWDAATAAMEVEPDVQDSSPEEE